MVPRRQSTLCSGTGGVGKTLLLLQLCLSVVLSKDWLGMMPEPGPVIFVGAEDEADELHRRVADGLKHYNASFSDLSDLHLLNSLARTRLSAAQITMAQWSRLRNFFCCTRLRSISVL